MSYSRHTWASGDVVSAARLNNIEDGIEGGFLVKHTVANNTLDCSYNDLLAEVNAGKLPYMYYDANAQFTVLFRLSYTNSTYRAYFGPSYSSWYGNSEPDEPLSYDD